MSQALRGQPASTGQGPGRVATYSLPPLAMLLYIHCQHVLPFSPHTWPRSQFATHSYCSSEPGASSWVTLYYSLLWSPVTNSSQLPSQCSWTCPSTSPHSMLLLAKHHLASLSHSCGYDPSLGPSCTPSSAPQILAPHAMLPRCLNCTCCYSPTSYSLLLRASSSRVALAGHRSWAREVALWLSFA